MGEHEREVAILQTQVRGLHESMVAMKEDRKGKDKIEENRYIRLEAKLDDALRIAGGRPTWGVMVLVTSLSVLCTSLATFIVTTL